MAFTYTFSKSGFTDKIFVYQDGNQIFTEQTNSGGQEALLRVARSYLLTNYPESGGNLTGPTPQSNSSSNTSSSTTTPPTDPPTTQPPSTDQQPPSADKEVENKLSPEEAIKKEYEDNVAREKDNYNAAKENIKKRKEKNQEEIDKYKNDPFKKQKEEEKKRKEKREAAKKRIREDKRKARKERANSVLKNAKKTLLPVVTLLLTNELAKVISQNSEIQKLIDDTNIIITDANQSGDPTKLANAKVVRDTTLRIIQDNEDKINKIKKQLNNISTYISIFNIIVGIIGPILLSTPVPTPDVVTTPKETFRRKVYEPALKLLNGLSALLPIISSILEQAIGILEDLKSQLLNLNGQLDNAVANGITELNQPIVTGDYPGYKGFKFVIKEETGPKAVVVAGNKRHYAIAIDKNNVEVLKSDYSFTLDPNDLIDQLKLIIDRQSLTA